MYSGRMYSLQSQARDNLKASPKQTSESVTSVRGIHSPGPGTPDLVADRLHLVLPTAHLAALLDGQEE